MKAVWGISALLCLAAGCREGRPSHTAAGAEQASRQAPATEPAAVAVSREAAARERALAFTRDFYAWYVPRGQDARERGVALVLRERSSALAPDLRRALQADEARQDSVAGEIAGLDFDPFLASQDPCDRYEVGEVTRDSAGFRIPVYGVCGGRRGERPAAAAEVVRVGDGWAFTNFYYGADGDDLRTTLRRLAGDHVP